MLERTKSGLFAGLVIACGLGLVPEAALAGECKGKLSGAVQGEFTCSVDASYRQKRDATALVIGVGKPPAGVQSLAPCSFDLKGKPQAGTLTLKDLGQGAAILTTADGKSFFASAQAGKGSLALEIHKVEPKGKRGFALTGKVTATLQAVDGPGQVQVEVSF